MATTVRVPPSLPPYDPPTTALPPLPVSKTRKSLPSQLAGSASRTARIPSAPQTPSKLRIPSKATIPLPAPKTPQHTLSNPIVPSLKTVASKVANGIGEKTLKKSVSIASFPQPPKLSSRIGRPSLGDTTINTTNLPAPKKSGSAETTPLSPAPQKLRRLKKSTSNVALHSAYSGSPSLLNGSINTVPIPDGAAQRISIALQSMPSAGNSRASSESGSFSTQATNFDDMEPFPQRSRSLSKDNDDASSKRSTLKEGKGNVVVSVRVRPNDGTDAKTDGEWMVDGRRSLIAFNGKEGGDYFYDNVFSPHDGNAKLYEVSAKRLVRRVMEGYHGTVFAYGMTGTGKTFSMQGIASQPGIIPQAVTDIFSYIRETPHREFLLRASYLEIYNEEIRDLLCAPPTGGAQPEKIMLREDSKRGVYATPVKEEIVQSPMQLLRVISRGDRIRHTGTTQYNLHSSRSHAVVKIVVESRERAPTEGVEDKRAGTAHGGVRVSSLSMIDLAGSEKAADSKERRTEGAHINKSLLTLGTVIARLSGDKDKNGNPTDKDGKHLPYRDSKLTRLLQPALSGSSLISILCTIQIGSTGSAATANTHTIETLNTLKFAARAKNNIVSHAKKAEEAAANSKDPGSIALLDHYRKEISSLRSQLDTSAQLQNKAEEVLMKTREEQMEKEMEDRHNDQMVEMQLARTALKERIEHLNRLILCSQSTGVNFNSNGSMSSLSLHPLLSAAQSSFGGARSIRSSASGSTIQSTIQRSPSGASQDTISSHLASLRSPIRGRGTSPPNGESSMMDMEDVYDEGIATLQSQNSALQSDLADKNRYISTLEKRLIQARRSSNSRASVGGSLAVIHDKDNEIAHLRAKLAELKGTVASLRANAASANQDADSSTTTPVSPSIRNHHASDSFGSSSAATSNSAFSPVEIPLDKQALPFDGTIIESSKQPSKRISEESQTATSTDRNSRDRVGAVRDSASNDTHRRSMEEMSRMLDEMIQEKVENGELVSDRKNGGVKVVRNRRQDSGVSAKSFDLTAGRVRNLREERRESEIGARERERHVGLGLGVEGLML